MVPHPRYLIDYGTLKPEQAAPLACSGVTTYSALKKFGKTLQAEPTVIIGAGGLGLMALALLKAMKGNGAIVVDIDPKKREAAKKAGAIATIDGRAPDAVAQIQAAAKNGVWSVVDFVGSSATVKLGIDSIIKGGTVVVVGLFGGDVTISTPFIPMKAMTLQGSYVGSPKELKELIALVRKTRVPAVPIDKRPLSEANAGLMDLKAGKVVGRVVLTPAG
jgi:alcohol dehydrogenase, propanol-preferring